MPKNQFERKDVQSLQQLRDEVKVRAHLLKSEMKNEWEKLEKEWNRVVGELAPTKRAAKESAQGLEEAAKLLLATMKQGYERIKRSLPAR